MKRIIYTLMTFSLIVGFWGCGGSGGGEDEPEPIPGEKVVKVECVLKSGVSSLDDTGLKGIISHVRLYVFDQAGKLQESFKYNSVDGIEKLELNKGNYTIVFVGNVLEDANIAGDVVGTALSDMKIQLTKKEGAANFTPLGDVLFAKSSLAVRDDDTSVELTAKRTLATTKMQVTDYSGKIAEVGILVPNVGTTLAFGETEWKNPGTVFVAMTKGGNIRGFSRAEEENHYSATMNIVVLDEGTSTGASNNIECNIIARDDTREIVLTQALTLDVKTKPDMQVVTNMEVNESDAGDGQLESAVNKVETTDETGNTEVLPDDKIDIKKNDVNVNVLPGDWQIGNTEDVEVGKPESVVQPEGTEKDWEKGNVEDVVVKD